MYNHDHMVRNSRTHPLRIDHVPSVEGGGRIGITLCPGKKQTTAMSGAWDRDLGADLDDIHDWGASAVVTLVEAHELEALQVARMGDEVARRHMAWVHLPIRDVDTPGFKFEAAWQQVGPALRGRLRRGFDVLIHCKGGLGRAGTVAAKLLVELGIPSLEALAAVRGARPGAVETRAQEKYVLAQQAVDEDMPRRTRSAIFDRGIGALAGLAVGDAVGTTLEFSLRDSYEPLAGMVGGGPFSLRAGEWTDDTAMALALADSLIAYECLDEFDLMQRFTAWRDEGIYSCTGRCFDIGITTSAAIDRWKRSGNPIAGSAEPRTAGNGSLMRLAPAALRHWRDREQLRDIAERQSATTHAAPAALAACSSFGDMLADAITGRTLDQLFADAATRVSMVAHPDVARVIAQSWRRRHRRNIRGSGYVVESLEAALWSVARSSSFAEAVLTAANLGEDADTTAAIAGQLAGAIYGLSGIPAAWIDRLAWKRRIIEVGCKLMVAGSAALTTTERPYSPS